MGGPYVGKQQLVVSKVRFLEFGKHLVRPGAGCHFANERLFLLNVLKVRQCVQSCEHGYGKNLQGQGIA